MLRKQVSLTQVFQVHWWPAFFAAMKRELPGDDAPWRDQRKRPRLPQPVDPQKVGQIRAQTPKAKEAVKKEDSLI